MSDSREMTGNNEDQKVAAPLQAGAAAHIGLIFDCDGVLLDSMDAWKQAEVNVCATVGKTPTKEDIDYVNTLTIAEAARFFYEDYGVGTSADDVARMIDESMMSYYSEQAQACAGALDFVHTLRAAGARMVVVSSSPLRYLNAGLGAVGLLPLLDGVFSADELQTSKRERFIFDEAHKLLGTDIAHTWGFDDTAYALETMANAGYKTLGIFSSDQSSSMAQLSAASVQAFERGFQELTAERFLMFA